MPRDLDKHHAAQKRWRDKNKGRYNDYIALYQFRKRNTDPDWHARELKQHAEWRVKNRERIRRQQRERFCRQKEKRQEAAEMALSWSQFEGIDATSRMDYYWEQVRRQA